MKRRLLWLWGTIWRALGLILAWTLIVTAMIAPTSNLGVFTSHHALHRLWFEAVPCIAIILVTWTFVKLIDRRKMPLLTRWSWRGIGLGALTGAVWLGAVYGVLAASGVVRIEGFHSVHHLIIWIAAAIINVAVQEYLVRGYLFGMLWRRHGAVAAAVVTTVLFVALHGGEGGVLGIIEVAAASLVFTLLVVATRSVIAAVVAHMVWNVCGALLLGVVSLGGVYPTIAEVAFHGSKLLTGGAMLAEGSLVTLLCAGVIAASLFWRIAARRRRAAARV